MNEHNPYAPTPASLAADGGPIDLGTGGTAVWRDGKVLVIRPQASMPPRCVKCNEPAHEPTKARKVYWHHPTVYALVLINIIIYAIVAALIRRMAVLAPALCAEHKKRRVRALRLAWAGLLGGIVVMYFGMATSFGFWAAMLGALLVVASVVGAMFFNRILYAQRIDKDYLRLKGCGTDFLASLPDFRG